MQIVEKAFEAEADSLGWMRDSMDKAIEQVRGFNSPEGGIMRVACPNAGRMIASIAAGHVSLEMSAVAFITSIAEDSGHDVAFGLGNQRQDTAVPRRGVDQPMVLGDGVTWEHVIEIMEIGNAYMYKRIERLEGRA